MAEVYQRHGRAVIALARRVIRDGSYAEEIAQEVFLGLWQHPEQFDPQRGALRSFLLTRTHGRSVDLIRSNESRKCREERTWRDTANAGYDVEDQVWDLTVADQIKESMTALPPDMRKPIELAYFDGHTYREVAKILQVPEGTVKGRIRTGLTRLRATMAARGVEFSGANS